MRVRMVLLSAVLLATIPAFSQSGEARFHTALANRRVRVYSLVLPPGSHAPLYQNSHRVLWIALNDGSPTLVAEDGPDIPLPLYAGDVRFLPPFQAKGVVNRDEEAIRGVVVELLEPRSNSLCDCTTAVARVVCGCQAAEHLPQLWAYALGDVMIAGTMLSGHGLQQAGERGDMLLVAITPVLLQDQAAEPGNANVRLDSGEAAWIEHGRHQFGNLSANPARFITVEF